MANANCKMDFAWGPPILALCASIQQFTIYCKLLTDCMSKCRTPDRPTNYFVEDKWL